MSRLQNVLKNRKKPLLNVYCTAGFPQLASTLDVMKALEEGGADIIELGMPYSDPLADGPVIQESSSVALSNGMTISVLLQQIKSMRDEISLPVILMGYLNPVLQYGLEKFCSEAAAAGVDGLIIPDIPAPAFEKEYGPVFNQYGLDFIFLVTPETSEERIKLLDRLSSGFLYAVSSSSVTGSANDFGAIEAYLKRLSAMQLKNPVLVGFGIKDKESFRAVTAYVPGAIIGTAFIKAISGSQDVRKTTIDFVTSILE
jgi:tryptophan synthase alpha chain